MKKCFFSVNYWFVLVVVCAYLGHYLDLFLITYLAAFAHELAHITVAKLLGIKISGIKIMPFGINAQLPDTITNTRHEILVAIAGPVFSLIVSVASLVLKWNHFALVNLSIAIVNLLPAIPLDGGRIVKALLSERWGFLKGINFTTKISKITSSLMLILGLAVLFSHGFNFSLILVVIFLMASFSREEKLISMVVIKNLVLNNEKLIKDDINKVRTIAVYGNIPARFILKSFSYNFYYIINVLSVNEQIISILTESQVIQGLANKGIRCKMYDICNFN